MLFELIQIHGEKNWAVLSRELKKFSFSKTGKQCRERWNNNLSPEISKESWTAEEEKILFELQKIHGNKWSVIAEKLEGRTDNSTKNHFYSIVRKNLRKFNKKQPVGSKLTGNLQTLLNDPRYSKILLKKPRHYSRKNSLKANSKDTSRKSSRKSSKRSSILASSRRVSEQTLDPEALKASLSTLPKPKAKINVRRSSVESTQATAPPSTVQKTDRRSSLNHLEINTEFPGFLSSPMNLNVFSTSNSMLFNSGQMNSFTFSEVDPNSPSTVSILNLRNRNRDNSIKSSESSINSRRQSRSNTGESVNMRSGSRKNSQNNPGEDGKKIIDYFDAADDKLMYSYQYMPNIPTYIYTTSFQFNKTPRAGMNNLEKYDQA